MKKISMGAFLTGAIAGLFGAKYGIYDKQIEALEDGKEKYYEYYQLYDRWLSYKQEGRSLEEYFLLKDYQKIAIYGMGPFGKQLYAELKNSQIQVVYGIDKNSDGTPYGDLPMVSLEKELEKVDCIVVSPFVDFCAIENDLYEKTTAEIVSLEEVVYEIDE